VSHSTLAPLSEASLELVDRAVGLLDGRRFAVLTGAGVSTDSGIPDYRGAGAPVRSPMTFQHFLSNESYRKRYWAGSHFGWKRFTSVEPNTGHLVLARMEEAGLVGGVITQNVDGLHIRAGSNRVVDLHGSMNRVRCLQCGQSYARVDIADRITALNPWIETTDEVEMNPDGDVDVTRADDFVIPDCTVCGGMLKPEVVFFGEFVPVEKFTEATALVKNAEALLIAGSSLVVNSGIRLLQQATRRKLPVIIINRGVTKGDVKAAVKIDAGTSETLALLEQRLLPERPTV
jgi:NAD-dependent SIR2 family protein deacetylase